MLGVEAVAVSEDVELLAQNLARQSKAVVAVTGKVDLVTDRSNLGNS